MKGDKKGGEEGGKKEERKRKRRKNKSDGVCVCVYSCKSKVGII